jgi:hypothetical protein
MAPTTATAVMRNETRHGTPSTPLSNPRPRKGEGKGDEGKRVAVIVVGGVVVKTPSTPPPSTAATVNKAAISTIGFISPLQPLTTTAITPVDDYHCHYHSTSQ